MSLAILLGHKMQERVWFGGIWGGGVYIAYYTCMSHRRYRKKAPFVPFFIVNFYISPTSCVRVYKAYRVCV